VQPGVRAVDNVDIPAVVAGDIVRLDHSPADIGVALVWATPKIGVLGDGGDEERHVLWVVRIADIEGAHTGIEVRDEDDLLEERRPELLIGGVRSEAAAPVAEPAFRGGDLRRGNRLRPALVGDVGQEREVAELVAEGPPASEVTTTMSRVVLASSLPVSVTKSGTMI
jgi:hypothetical protein